MTKDRTGHTLRSLIAKGPKWLGSRDRSGVYLEKHSFRYSAILNLLDSYYRFSAPPGVLFPQISGQFSDNWPLICGRNTPGGALNILITELTTQLNSTGNYGRRCKHLYVRINMSMFYKNIINL